MLSKDNFVLNVTKNGHIITIQISASQKVKLSDLAEKIYYECLSSHGRFYMHQTLPNTAYEVLFTNSEGKTHHFCQHTLWLNPITLLSDIARQINV